jgi:hypothetical protein
MVAEFFRLEKEKEYSDAAGFYGFAGDGLGSGFQRSPSDPL